MTKIDPDWIAQAMQPTKPQVAAPARATAGTAPRKATPARANQEAASTEAPPARANVRATSTAETPARADALTAIRLLGRTLDDLERLRIMHGNRVAAALRDGHDVPWIEVVNQQLEQVEHAAELELKRSWRKHPLAPWAKQIPGCGELLMARLIAEIGDPADRPNPGKLLAYCGHGDPARAGQVPKGATQEELFKRGNPAAKKATWKLAYQFMRTVGTIEPTVETETTRSPARPDADNDHAIAVAETNGPARGRAPRSPYRDIYDARKTATEGRLHAKTCVRCGPSGHPAPAGSPWSDAHRHADALRIVGKRFLIDLWVASRHSEGKSHTGHAGGDQ